MRMFVLALSVFLLFSSSLHAIPFQGKKGEVQVRKWSDSTVFVYADGKLHPVKAFLTADEKCGNTRETDVRVRCYRDFSILPQEPEPLEDSEMEIQTDKGILIRITEEIFCISLEAAKKNNAILFASCHALWEEYVRQQKK